MLRQSDSAIFESMRLHSSSLSLSLALLLFACASPRKTDSSNRPPQVAQSKSSDVPKGVPNTVVLVGAPDRLAALDAPLSGTWHGASWTGPDLALAHNGRQLFRIDVRKSPPGVERVLIETSLSEIESLAGAAGADVGAFWLKNEKQLVILRNGKESRRISLAEPPVHGLEKDVQLSDDGEVVVVESAGSESVQSPRPTSAAFATATGVRVGTLPGIRLALEASGKYVASSSGVYEVTGTPALQLKQDSEAHAWLGANAVFLNGRAMMVFDSKTASTKSVSFGCTGSAGPRVIDRALERVVVECSDRVVFINVADLVRTTVLLAAGFRYDWRKASPEEQRAGWNWQPELDANGSSVFLSRSYRKGEYILVNPLTKLAAFSRDSFLKRDSKRRSLGGFPCRTGHALPLTSPRCDTVDVSKSGAFALAETTLGISLIDVKAGTVNAHFGAPEFAWLDHASFRANGIDLVYADSTRKHTARLGAEAPAESILKPLAPCDGDPMQQVRSGEEVFTFMSSNTVCACTAGSCKEIRLQAQVIGLLPNGILVQDTRAHVVRRLDFRGIIQSEHPLPQECSDGHILESGDVLVMRCQAEDPRSKDNSYISLSTFREYNLPSFAPGAVYAPANNVRLLGGNAHILAFVEDAFSRTTETFRIVDRKTRTTRAILNVWQNNTVVRYPDGRIRFEGPDADKIVYCVSGMTLLPLATCRAAVEKKEPIDLFGPTTLSP
jgi:hypothetical protein